MWTADDDRVAFIDELCLVGNVICGRKLTQTWYIARNKHDRLYLSEDEGRCHLSRDNLKHFYLPNPSHQFNFSLCNLCTVS